MNALSALKVQDQDFLVASTIDRCPRIMMIRELFTNAVEAATKTVGGNGKVEFDEVLVHNTPKLALWNTGPGMTASELVEMTNLASSIGKAKGLDKNFGMGAKVASLPSNKLGLRYRSCFDGVVHEVLLCCIDGIYGRMHRYDIDGNELGEVLDVTDQVIEEGLHSLDSDWTEVVLFGNRPDQNTILDPYDGNPPQERQWLATSLYHRFYRLPSSVSVRMKGDTHKLREGTRRFEPITERLRFFKNYETVHVGNGINVHYLFDAPLQDTSHNNSISGSITSDVSTCAVIHKNEMYALLKKRDWKLHAPSFGIPFGAQHLSIHIELPDESEVLPEAYRQFLRYKNGEQKEVQAIDFANLVAENRPEWFIELIHSFAPSNPASDDEIRNSLQDLLNKLRVRTTSPKVKADGLLQLDAGSGKAVTGTWTAGVGTRGSGEGRKHHLDMAVTSHGAKMAQLTKNMERAPELVRLNDDEEIRDKQIQGRAGRYYSETGTLYLNMKYPAIEQMNQMLVREYQGTADPEVMQRLALELSQDSMVSRVGCAVVFALAKRLNKEWDEDALQTALKPESITLAADNIFESLQNARRKIGTTLRTSGEKA